MPRKAASLKSGSSSHDRLEPPRLLRAVEANDFSRVKDIIQEARDIANKNPHFLSIGLIKACDKNLVDVARLLLSQGADANYVPGSKLSSLRRATESSYVELAKALIDHGADLEAGDKKGRTALMTAAWKDNFEFVQLLLDRGASVHTVDLRKRTVLHNIAADKRDEKAQSKALTKARSRCGMTTVEYLIERGVNIEARDVVGRTALHWACVTDNEDLLRTLLKPMPGSISPRAEVNCVDGRMKTPLHLAVSHNRVLLAQILLENHASIDRRSDGGWSALHNACLGGQYSLVAMLLNSGADANAELLNGRTPLHVAAEYGNEEAARCLLDQPRTKRAVKDRFGNTPLLIAAQHGKKKVVEMLAPWNHMRLLSAEEVEAAQKFNATIVDFGHFRNENKVTRVSVYDLLYARDPKDSNKHLFSTMTPVTKNVKPLSFPPFRWVHLPVNNIAWCDALLTKRFIEEDAHDVEGYKALEASFNHQHRGQQHHARFMRPMCQSVHRSQEEEKPPETPRVVIHEAEAESSFLETPERVNSSPEPGMSPPGPSNREAREQTLGDSDLKAPVAIKSPKARYSETPSRQQGKSPRRQPSRRQSRSGDKLNLSPSRRGSFRSLCNVYFFMPYLHFETDTSRKAMQTALETPLLPRTPSELSQDEILIRAHMSASSSFLHIRRTLDQFFYHNIDTHMRDSDQVVYRFQKKHPRPSDPDPKIFMVDQLWMWILGKDLVVTSFPQRWQQPRDDPLNVLEGIIQDINSRTRDPVQNVFELAMTITGRCFGTFDRHRKADDEFQFMDMFEASIGNAMDLEAKLFREFSAASRQASAWLKSHARPTKFARSLQAATAHAAENSKGDQFHFDDHEHVHEPLFVDKLLDVGAETDLLSEIKDIREELDIIRMVLGNQNQLLPELRDSIRSIYRDEHWNAQLRRAEKKFEEQDKTITNPMKDIDRMKEQAERIYGSIRDLLDLKQKHANAFEARFARDQAAGTVRQGRTIMVFTIVTVVFLPLSFIAALFTINVENWPHDNKGDVSMPLSYVSAYTFGIGLAISVPLILIALSVDELSYGYGQVRKWIRNSWRRLRPYDEDEAKRQSDIDNIEQTLKKSRSMRRSVELSELQWNGRLRAPPRQLSDMAPTKRSWDVERGMRYP